MDYTIYESNLEKYIEINGKRNLKNPICNALKEKTARYYIIEEVGEFYDDFSIYLDEDNLLVIDKRYFFKDDLIKEIIKFLNKDYKILTLLVALEKTSLIEIIKKRFKNIKIEKIIKYGYDINKITIVL